MVSALQAELETRQIPADRVVIIANLARLANHFRTERPADSWEMLFDDYANDLHGISASHLVEIIDAHRRERSWFPKVAELTERWNKLKWGEHERLRRARVLLGLEPPKPWEKIEPAQ